MTDITESIHLNIDLSKPSKFKGRSVEEGRPITAPLDNLEELLAWRSDDTEDHGQLFSIASGWFKPKIRNESEAKTLLCHDMEGGYLQDRFVQGSSGPHASGYYMEYWNCVDIFVYFSHHFVTIPPVGWVNACHRNGVAVLGTLITEFDSGYKRWRSILCNKEMCEVLVKKLVEIATYYRFDGWLLNVENVIEPASVPLLVEFVKALTVAMHKAVPHSLVIWYDSVTKDGELKWQNELNEENSCFYNACDGIFLNYVWNEENLDVSKRHCRSTSSVFVGIDVFGRGCYGGGGFNSKEALSLIRKYDLSVALFAPGWVYEVFNGKQFEENNRKFWKYLHQLCPPGTLDVDKGIATRFHKGLGTVGCSTLRYHLNCQDTMPILPSDCLSVSDDKLEVKATSSSCYIPLFRMKMQSKNGEASLKIPSSCQCSFILSTNVGKCFLKQIEDCNGGWVIVEEGRGFKVKFIVGLVEKQWLISYTSAFILEELSVHNERHGADSLSFLQVLPCFSCSTLPSSSNASLHCVDVDWQKDEDEEDQFFFGCTLVFDDLPQSWVFTQVHFQQGKGSDECKGTLNYLGASYCPRYRLCEVKVSNPQFHGPDCYLLLVARHCSGIGEVLREDKLRVTYAQNT